MKPHRPHPKIQKNGKESVIVSETLRSGVEVESGTAVAPTNPKRSKSMSEGRFRIAFEKAPIGMAIVDLNLRLRRVNKSLCDALGYEEEELLSRRVVDITHPDDAERDMALAQSLIRGEIPSYRLEKRFLTKKGDLAWLDLTALVIRTDRGDPLYGLAMVENITERKRSQEALRRSEERYRSFVVNSTEGIWRLEIEQPVDTRLPVTEQVSLFQKFAYLAECNDELAHMHGLHSANEMLGWRYEDFALASSPIGIPTLKQFVSSGYRLLNLQTEVVDDRKRRRYLSSNLIGIVINDRLLRVWGVQNDQTEQRTVEIQLRHSHQQLRSLSAHLQSLREKERTNIAREMHDTLGQLLTSTKIEVSLLKRKLDSEKRINRLSLQKKLNEIGDLLQETISTVKALSTELRPGVLDKFGLVAAMEWQCREFSSRSGIECNCSLLQKELPLHPELSTTIFRILQEALTNVVRHSGADCVCVDLTGDHSSVALCVSDNGKGITKEEILSPTSLGLLGMQERTESCGGKFTIGGKVGEGTVVRCVFPIPRTRDETTQERKDD